MACPVGTVMSRINRGRRTLARLLRAARPHESPLPRETKEQS